jgi:hypothetical protein
MKWQELDKVYPKEEIFHAYGTLCCPGHVQYAECDEKQTYKYIYMKTKEFVLSTIFFLFFSIDRTIFFICTGISKISVLMDIFLFLQQRLECIKHSFSSYQMHLVMEFGSTYVENHVNRILLKNQKC